MKMTDSMTLSQGTQWQLRQNLFDMIKNSHTFMKVLRLTKENTTRRLSFSLKP